MTKESLWRFKMTKGNVDDRVYVPELTQKLKGFMAADKGYISKIYFYNYTREG